MQTNTGPRETEYYAMSAPDVIAELKTDALLGLSTEEVKQRQAIYGKNKIATGEKRSPLRLFLKSDRRHYRRP